jgi:hypothetical protein
MLHITVLVYVQHVRLVITPNLYLNHSGNQLPSSPSFVVAANHHRLPSCDDSLPCPAGEYNNQNGLASCLKCTAGSVQPSTGSTACNNCTAGTYISATGATQCLPSPIGTYANVNGSSSYIVCEEGTVQPITGQTYCVECGLGSYQPATQQGSWLVFFFSSIIYDSQLSHSKLMHGNNDNSLLCDSGYFANVTGLSVCLQCAAGTYSVKTTSSGAWNCTLCHLGQAIGAPGQGPLSFIHTFAH